MRVSCDGGESGGSVITGGGVGIAPRLSSLYWPAIVPTAAVIGRLYCNLCRPSKPASKSVYRICRCNDQHTPSASQMQSPKKPEKI
ncbi:hypothetical protein BD626DRAFT_573994 [Schizophyllum amplum]|uniref:Uncharacterized protein n=1 Tax=Schizophyllum amplum TaxID=97359 RepID=A0A550BZN4_9AGAR|nr:hypothetical protein BD626DRAFT_573994 [Auriculariopsis ampla]